MDTFPSDKITLKQIREKLEITVEESLPEVFKNRHQNQKKGEAVEKPRVVDVLMAKRIVESILFSTSRPVGVDDLSKVLTGYKGGQILDLIRELQNEYISEGRSFQINEIAAGFELATGTQYAKWIEKADIQKKPKLASVAALETLAVIAYKQPITRGEVEGLRGVDVSGILSTLLERDFIAIAGRKEVPGRPLLYRTTDFFLEHFGLKGLEDLPRIHEIRDIVQASIRREELLEKQKQDELAKNSEEERQKARENRKNFDWEQAEIQGKYHEIAEEIDGVKVYKEKEIQEIVQPMAKDELKIKLDTNLESLATETLKGLSDLDTFSEDGKAKVVKLKEVSDES